VVNVFFSPNSFGGATIVAEEMVNYMAEFGFNMGVFTSSFFDEINQHDIVRTSYKKSTVFRVGLNRSSLKPLDYLHENIHEYFQQALDAFKPDLVHFHSIQGIGAGVAEICKLRKIPYIITLHDYWWLCEKQFMTNQHGKFCGQKIIEESICAKCVNDVEFTQKRTEYLRKTLNKADMITVPGRYMYDFYLKNGIDKNQLFINKNGIHIPDRRRPNRTRRRLVRFGFVAGSETTKGYYLIKQVFESLNSSIWELCIVDHISHNNKLGKTEIEVNGRGSLKIFPKYTKETLEAYFNAIDVLLFPTQVPESFGLTVREALIRNKWVIATNAGGITEDITDGLNGTLIPLSPDPKYLKNAVEYILKNRKKLNGWVNPTSNKIRSFKQQAEELAELYDKLLT
jgi:glycosyltransferase involved in cell wall biosynthesis